MSTTLAASELEPATVPVQVVDCDIHVNPRHGLELPNSMPEPWLSKGYRELLFAGNTLGTSVIFASPNEGRRLDAFTPLGPPGSDPNVTGRQLFDEVGVDLAIIIPMMEKNSANPEHEAAIAATMNNWLAQTWLGAMAATRERSASRRSRSLRSRRSRNGPRTRISCRSC